MLGTWLQERYRLDTELGRGGMGVVYRAHDTLLGRDVAVKVLLNTAAPGSEGSEGHTRLLREAQATARLNHPNIVAIHDAGQTMSGEIPLPYIVMELVEGTTLREIHPPNIEESITIASQICAALVQAHASGIIHRDLKPDNIILTPSGVVKLMDFGLAQVSMATQLTAEGAIVGTASYLAPELIQGQTASEQSDLYALGVVLYELVAGRPPFEGGNLTAVLSQHLFAPVVPPSTYNEAIPSSLDHLILDLLAKTSQERPASAEAVWRDIQNFAQPSSDASKADVLPIERMARGRLVAREQETAEAIAVWNRALGGAGQALLISGEPGIGKTRLVQDLMVRAKANRALVLLGECYAEGGAPYAPIAHIVGQVLANYPADELALPEFACNGLVALAPTLQIHFPETTPAPLRDPQAEQQRLLDSLLALFTKLAELTPILLVVDDVHWADSGTLAVVRYLARRGRALRLLLTLTFRDVELAEARALNDLLSSFNRERLATQIQLTRLDMEQTRQLLATLFAEEITPEFLQAVYRETEGNPFFVEEVCKALIDSGQVYLVNGRWQRPVTAEMEIPPNVRVAIESRLNRLPETVQTVLRVAAVIGRKFEFDTLVQLSDLDEDSLIEVLEQAERTQLIAEVGHSGGGAFTFTHALIPSTLADGLSGLRRRRLHRQVATAIAQNDPEAHEILAHHYNSAGDKPQACRYYGLAADRALASFANEDAERYYRAALELAPETNLRAPLLAGLANSLANQTRFEEAFSLWPEAIEAYRQLEDYDQMALLYTQFARNKWARKDTQGSLDTVRQGMAAIQGQPETAGVIGLLSETGRIYFFNELQEDALPLCQRALELAKQQQLLEVQAEAMINLELLSPQWSLEENVQYLIKARDLAMTAGALGTAFRAENNCGATMARNGQWGRAVDHYRKAIVLAQRMGRRHYELHTTTNLIDLLIHKGPFAEVRQFLNKAFEVAYTLPEYEVAITRLKFQEMLFYQMQGLLSQAIEIAQEMINEPGFTIYLIDMFFELDALDKIEPLMPPLIAQIDACPVEHYAPIIHFYALQGEQGLVEQLLTKMKTFVKQNSSSWLSLCLARAEARLANVQGGIEDINHHYKIVCDYTVSLGLAMVYPRDLLEWAKALQAHHAPVEMVRPLLEEALTHFETLDVPVYAKEVRERLASLAHH